MAHKPTNVFFRNHETGWCSHATVVISDIAEFKRKHHAVDLPIVERKAGVAKDSHCPKKCTATTVLEGQLTVFIPAPNGHKFVVLEEGETGIFMDYEAGKPHDAYEGHGSIAGRFGVKLLPSELTDEPNLNAYGFAPV
ncbi:MAG TPA: hypothetical protein VGI40_18600 [Pirellulaceae bacterium]|jgi:hypothetical protein